MARANPELPELTGPDAEHANGIWAMWHDPTRYDPLRDGPPYLPPSPSLTVTASLKTSDDKAALALLAQILQMFASDFGQAVMAELSALLCFLRAEAIIHQSHHWQTRGTTYYGDHLLYDRLYGEVQELIDPLAERAVGQGSRLLVQPLQLAMHTAALVQSLYADAPPDPSPDDYALLSLRTVLRFLALHRMVYFILDKRGQLSHGLDNLLQGIADKHEEHVYLLRQRTTSYDHRV